MMKNFFWSFVLLLPFLSSFAQSSNEEEMEVTTKMLTLKTALLKKDSATLSGLLAGDVTYGHTNGLVQTKAQIIRSVVSGEQDYKTIEPSDMKIRTYGGMAVVNMNSRVNMLYNGNPLDLNMAVTLVWIKEKDWILVARQSVKL